MFSFKHFSIQQDRCTMKVGTDGVLLGAWAEVLASDRRILDIGTGTGLIALMAAQRAEAAQVVGVDVDDVSQACENAAASPWAERMHFEQIPVQEFTCAEPFDLIISNPPFFIDSLTCPDAKRTMVRHAVSLPFEALRDAVVRLLSPEGRFAIILPTAEGEQFCALCRGSLVVRRQTDVRTTPRRTPKRVLLEFSRAGEGVCAPPQWDLITIGTGGHETYTSEYRTLTQDFYLNF